MKTTEINNLPTSASPYLPEQIRSPSLTRRASLLKPITTLALAAIAIASANADLSAPIIPSIPNNPIYLFPFWSGWKQIPDSGLPFLTDVGCAAASYPGQALYVAAQKASDHTIWLNSTWDPSSKPWVGWYQVKPLPNGVPAKTAYSPSISYFYDVNTGAFWLDLVAVGIHGGWDMGVYIISLNLIDNQWTSWSQVPGSFGTNAGVSIKGRRLYARGFSYGGGISNGTIYYTFYEGPNTSSWHQVNGFITNARPCPTLTTDGGTSDGVGGLYASQASDKQIYSLQNVPGPLNTSINLWFPVPFQPLTDTKAAGPLPNTPKPIYSVFVKGIGDHQVHGVRSSGLELIGGNKFTDSGIDSCTVTNWDNDLIHHLRTYTYQNMLFVKDMGDHKIYFKSFTTTSTVPFSFF
jgi:hypothetical protein